MIHLYTNSPFLSDSSPTFAARCGSRRVPYVTLDSEPRTLFLPGGAAGGYGRARYTSARIRYAVLHLKALENWGYHKTRTPGFTCRQFSWRLTT